MPASYESQSGTLVRDPSPSDVDFLLGQLDGADNSYASLTASNGSYVQAGGGPTGFTAEVREVHPDGSFRHLKATVPGTGAQARRLTIGGADVSVRADQVLDLTLVREIFRSFLQDGQADSRVVWRDITSMFRE
jgi:hypothetical protein